MTQNKTNREPPHKASNKTSAAKPSLAQRALAWISKQRQTVSPTNKTAIAKTAHKTAHKTTNNNSQQIAASTALTSTALTRSAFSLSAGGIINAAYRTILDTTSGLISIGIIWLGILTILMNRPSIDLSMVKPHYEKWFSQAFAGNTSNIEQVSARWVDGKAEIEIRANNIVIGGIDGQTQTIETLRASFALPANIFTKPILKSIHIKGGMMTIIHGADNRYRIGLGRPQSARADLAPDAINGAISGATDRTINDTIRGASTVWGPVWISPPSGRQKQVLEAARSAQQSKWNFVRRAEIDAQNSKALPVSNGQADPVMAALLGLNTIRVNQATLHYLDEVHNIAWSFNDVDGHYQLIDETIYIQTKGRLGGHVEPAPFTWKVTAKLGGPDIAISMTSKNVRPALMAPKSGPFKPLARLDAPVDLDIDLSLISGSRMAAKRAAKNANKDQPDDHKAVIDLPELMPETFLERLDIRFKAGKGQLKTGKSFKPFEQASLIAAFDIATQSVNISALNIQSQALNITAEGRLQQQDNLPPVSPQTEKLQTESSKTESPKTENEFADPDWPDRKQQSLKPLTGSILPAGFDVPIGFDLEVHSFRLNLGTKYKSPIQGKGATLVGLLDVSQHRVQFDQMDVDFGAFQTRFSGVFDQLETGAFELFKLDGAVDGILNPRHVLAYWPNDFALGARNWVQKSVINADLSNIVIHTAITGQDIRNKKIHNDHVNLQFDTDNVDVRYLRSMPWLRGTQGHVLIQGNQLAYHFSGGEVAGLVVGKGTVDIPHFAPRGGDLIIDIETEGAVAKLLALSNHPPLRFADRYGIIPENFGGSGQAKLKITRPLLEHYDKTRIRTDLRGQFTNVSLPAGLGKYKVHDGALSLQANRQEMQISGPIKIGQWQGDVHWKKAFSPPSAVNALGDSPVSKPGKFKFSSRVDRQTLDRFGIGLRRHFGGYVDVELSGEGDGLDVRALAIMADFKNADLNIGNLWHKPTGQDGTLTGVLILDKPQNLGANSENSKGVGGTLQDFVIKADGLELAGTVQLASDMRLKKLDLSRAKIDGLMDASLTGKSSETGVFVFDIKGKHFNLSPWVDKAFKTQSGLISTPVTLRADLQSLTLDENYSLSNAHAEYSHNGQSVVRAQLTGQAKDGPFTAKIQRDQPSGKRLFVVEIPNAGHAAKSLLGLDSAIGGAMKIQGELPGFGQKGGIVGTASLRDFKVVRAPFFAQILSLASLRGLSDTLGGGGVAFEKMETKFSLEQGLLKIREGRASGSALGLTGEGDIDLARKELNFDGVLVPSYTVNSILGDIPILGNIMVGKKGEGMFALNYAIKGPFESVQISVNPLSALTPGFLRRIFDVKRDKIRDETVLDVIEQQKQQ